MKSVILFPHFIELDCFQFGATVIKLWQTFMCKFLGGHAILCRYVGVELLGNMVNIC